MYIKFLNKLNSIIYIYKSMYIITYTYIYLINISINISIIIINIGCNKITFKKIKLLNNISCNIKNKITFKTKLN